MTYPILHKKGSVQVTELWYLFFMQVHQMISTVTSKLDYQYGAVDAIRKSPMGSMTGAPKISAMKIIEDLEETKEDCTGSGLLYAQWNFDFNVIIRSILYNQENQYVFFL
jgi:para-aminobenzoate synthetase component 1